MEKKDATNESRRRYSRFGRVLMSFAALCLLLSLCSLKASAYEIDTSKFLNINDQIQGTTIYYWYTGLPPADERNYGYPTLVVWDDKYYWKVDPSDFYAKLLAKSIRRGGTKQLQNDVPGNFWGADKDDIVDSDGYYAHVYDHSLIFGDSYYSYKSGYPAGYYRYSVYFNNSGALLSQLDFMDFNTLKSVGTTVSLELPMIPEFYYGGKSKNGNPTYAFKGYSQNTNPMYIVGYSEYKTSVSTSSITDVDLNQDAWLNWQLGYVQPGGSLIAGDLNLNKDKSKKVWEIIPSDQSDYYYIYQEDGYRWNDISRISHRWSTWKDVEKMRDRTVNHTYMLHKSDKIGSRGYQTAKPTTTGKFRFYYADPMLMPYLNGDFAVQSGQVTSLDGPVLIPRNRSITVKDGGVLSVSNWVINNGTIKVEAGGTLLVQDDATISTWEDDAGLHAGRIACDGIMIISSGGKVHSGGIDGLKFGEGAVCINYGTIIAENLTVYSDHTIENRGTTSQIFAGWGSTESGYGLMTIGVSGQNYPGKGTQEKSLNVNLPAGAVYGPGASRVYTNSKATVTSTMKKGSACPTLSGTDPAQAIQPAPKE